MGIENTNSTASETINLTRDTVEVKGSKNTYMHLSVSEDALRESLKDLCVSLNEPYDKISDAKLKVTFGSTAGAFNDLAGNDLLAKLDNKLMHSSGAYGIVRLNNDEYELILDVQKVNDQIDALSTEFLDTKFSALPDEVKITAMKNIFGQLMGHEMVHIIQFINKPDEMSIAEKQLVFGFKAELVGIMAIALSTAYAVSTPDIRTIPLPAIALAAHTKIISSINKSMSWVEKQAYEVQSKLVSTGFVDPIKYDIET